ncbi:MAG: SGNH/GDSL hydrolase family protein [Eubacteriales bacterium]|nr:SGNH/GDSL hydrolase family protein [Eubacteriales bacterium]
MKKHIVCFGDSNTHGYCAANGGRFDENERWTCLLQKKLGEDYLILEEGLSGRTTSFRDPLFEGLAGLDYLYPCLMSHEPVDLLVIMLGTNDTKERFGASAACIALGLKRLIGKALATADCWRDGKPNILVVTPQNIGPEYAQSEVGGTMGRGCAEKSQGLAAEYEKIAEMMGCHYLDANKVVQAGPNDIDFMHLTAEGHKQLAEALAEKIPQIL